MKWLAQIVPALVISYLLSAVFVALLGMFLKGWYLIFLMGWNAL